MTQFSNKFKKLCFWPIFGPFLGQKKFSYGFLAPCQNLEKVNDTIQRKRLDRRGSKKENSFFISGRFGDS